LTALRLPKRIGREWGASPFGAPSSSPLFGHPPVQRSFTETSRAFPCLLLTLFPFPSTVKVKERVIAKSLPVPARLLPRFDCPRSSGELISSEDEQSSSRLSSSNFPGPTAPVSTLELYPLCSSQLLGLESCISAPGRLPLSPTASVLFPHPTTTPNRRSPPRFSCSLPRRFGGFFFRPVA